MTHPRTAFRPAAPGETLLEHFQEKWKPVFRPKMRHRKKIELIQFPWKLNEL
jgi:hypothetical protein